MDKNYLVENKSKFRFKVNWKNVGNILFLIGWGITLHAVVDELLKKGGLKEVLTIQGEYIGLFLVMLGWTIFNWRIIFNENK